MEVNKVSTRYISLRQQKGMGAQHLSYGLPGGQMPMKMTSSFPALTVTFISLKSVKEMAMFLEKLTEKNHHLRSYKEKLPIGH